MWKVFHYSDNELEARFRKMKKGLLFVAILAGAMLITFECLRAHHKTPVFFWVISQFVSIGCVGKYLKLSKHYFMLRDGKDPAFILMQMYKGCCRGNCDEQPQAPSSVAAPQIVYV